jgi:hypothetical protein
VDNETRDIRKLLDRINRIAVEVEPDGKKERKRKHPELAGLSRKEYRRLYYRKYFQTHKRQSVSRICTVVNGKTKSISVPNKRPRPTSCELCERTVPRLQYHHWDPDYPAKGLWLCGFCHIRADALDNEHGYSNKYKLVKERVEASFVHE